MALLEHILPLSITALILWLLVDYFTSPLRHIQGPFLAKFTDLWRLYDHWRLKHLETQRRLHDKYGVAVRIGPNIVSLSDPDLLKTVYSTRGEYLKSDHFTVADGQHNGRPVSTIFSTRSNAFHAQKTQPIAKLYSLPSILKIENLTDQSLVNLCHQLDSRFAKDEKTRKPFNMAEWIDFFAWDNSFQLAFSKAAGFMEKGQDVDGILHAGESTMRYIQLIGQMPFLDRLLGKNPCFPFKIITLQSVVDRCIELIMERVGDPSISRERTDMLDSFLEAKETYPDVVEDSDVLGYAVSIMAAGSDTSASLEKAVIYHVLKNPAILAKLQAELDAAGLSFPPKYSEVEALPYLDATIKEGLRIHPPIGILLERIVPRSGLKLHDGRVIPAGTIVGMNAWVLTRNQEIFGDDVDVFRPERWLQEEGESGSTYKERVSMMKEASFSWGGGNRVCIGKNMATVSVYKVIATIFRNYDLELTDRKKEWTLHKYWLVFPKRYQVRASRRIIND